LFKGDYLAEAEGFSLLGASRLRFRNPRFRTVRIRMRTLLHGRNGASLPTHPSMFESLLPS